MNAKYKPLFKDQDIDQIRDAIRTKRNVDKNFKFKDDRFPAHISSILSENAPRGFVEGLGKNLGCQDKSKFEWLVTWQRISSIVGSHNKMHGTHLMPQFVLDDSGHAPERNNVKSYVSCFETNDSFQGYLGNCFHVAALMSVVNTKNEDLILKLFPIDNACAENIELGVFHFRFWYYGEWVDVVVDDYIATALSNNILFCHNDQQRNEFWAPLAEKAFAKLWGSYGALDGGFDNYSLMLLTGGISNNYFRDSRARSFEMISSTKFGKDDSLPLFNEEDAIEIITIGLNRNFTVNCGFTNDFFIEQAGVIKNVLGAHAYMIANIKEEPITNGYLILLDEPHNRNKTRSENERGQNKKSNKASQIWMKSRDFLQNLHSFCVFNIDCGNEYQKVGKN